MDQMMFMDALFTNPDIKITDLKKGLTNQNFLLEMNNEAFVLRTPRFDSGHIVDRHHETLALAAIKDSGIDVETIYYDEISGYKVTRYLKDAKDFSEYHGSDRLVRCANLMKRFHGLQRLSGVNFQPFERYKNYRDQVHTVFYDLQEYENILEQVNTLHYERVLCHNDWVEGNILFAGSHTYLIDYEYAADNDPLFDVMSFLTENKIVDTAQREDFYHAYFDELTPQIRYRLYVWEVYHNLLWCMWAMMMWEHRHEAIYKMIAKDKYDALRACYHKDR